jgi:hypothetical protein
MGRQDGENEPSEDDADDRAFAVPTAPRPGSQPPAQMTDEGSRVSRPSLPFNQRANSIPYLVPDRADLRDGFPPRIIEWPMETLCPRDERALMQIFKEPGMDTIKGVVQQKYGEALRARAE